jgi:hypothetical protein
MGGAGGTSTGVAGSGGINGIGLASVASADGVTRTTPVASTTSNSIASGFDSIFDPWRAITGGGSAGIISGVTMAYAGTGGGIGGVAVSAGGVVSLATSLLGGVGGCASNSSSASISCGNLASLFGGGSGGVATANGATYSATSAKGGNGLVTIERVK